MRIPIIISLTLAAFGLVYVVIVCMAEGWESSNGVQHILNDPGKNIFHLFLLPTAAFVFASRFPIETIRAAFSSHRSFAIGVIILLFIIATLFVIKDAKDGMCLRLPAPADLQSEASGKLKQLYFDLHAHLIKIREASLDTVDKVDIDEWWKSHGCKPPTKYNEKQGIFEFKKKWSENASECYRINLDQYRSNNNVQGENKNCKYWAIASWRNIWSACLSFLGTAFVLIVFWVIILHVITRTRLNDKTFTTLVMVAFLVIPWLVLRILSEWYLSFGNFDFKIYPPIYAASFLAIAVGILIAMLKSSRTISKIWAAVSVIASLTITIISSIKPEWINIAAGEIYIIDPFYQATYYFIIVSTLYLIIYYIAGEESV